MDQELIVYLDERFRETTAQRFDRLEEKVRHNGVEIEALRGEILQVSERASHLHDRPLSLQPIESLTIQFIETENRIDR
ncbi:MAG TPA: hypothetical protein VLV54_01975 [Thermoanaerobaculia bacterium]|nr:hypothetical protein [Thermoanaerobaculia bacterium]